MATRRPSNIVAPLQLAIPELPFLVSLLDSAAHFLPPANPTSPIVTHFGYGSSIGTGDMSWPLLRQRLEKVFGERERIDKEAIAPGPLGLGLVVKAFENLVAANEDEFVQMEMWCLALTKALVSKMNEAVPFGYYDITGKLHATNGRIDVAAQSDPLAGPSNGHSSPHRLPEADPIVTSNGHSTAPDDASTSSVASTSKLTKKTPGKRASTSSTDPARKRVRRTSPGPNRPRAASALSLLPTRTFPPSIVPLPNFPRFYRKFYTSSAFPPGSPAREVALARGEVVMDPPEGASWNAVSDLLDLYVPRFTKGSRDEKVGMCPICIESVVRGGEGEEKWLNLRNSSYVYHMSFYHGVSKSLGLPFSPPIETRTVDVPKTSKSYRAEMLEGRCHHCNEWIQLQSLKALEAVVPEIFWWKHTKTCHGTSKLAGEMDDLEPDAYYLIALQAQAPPPSAPFAGIPVNS